MRITRIEAAPAYHPPKHQGVDCKRLQGHEAGETSRFWTGLSTYAPGGAAELSPVASETIYTLIEGELTLISEGREDVLKPYDSVHLIKGEVRALENRSARPAILLVAIAYPEA